MANDILDGSFRSNSSQHSNSGAMAADLIRNINSEEAGQRTRGDSLSIDLVGADLMRNINEEGDGQTAHGDSQSMDLVGGLMGASPGIILVEDETLNSDNLDLGHSNSLLLRGKETEEKLPKLDKKVERSESSDGMGVVPRVPPSPGGSSHSSGPCNTSTGNPMLIDSLRKAMQPKTAVDISRLSNIQVRYSGVNPSL